MFVWSKILISMLVGIYSPWAVLIEFICCCNIPHRILSSKYWRKESELCYKQSTVLTKFWQFVEIYDNFCFALCFNTSISSVLHRTIMG
jgi:hypothetical protein